MFFCDLTDQTPAGPNEYTYVLVSADIELFPPISWYSAVVLDLEQE